MKNKFLMIFALVLLATVISLFYTTSSLRGKRYSSESNERININNQPEKKSDEKEKVVVVVNNCNTTSEKSEAKKTLEPVKEESIDYLKKYPSFLKCKNSYNEWAKGTKIEPPDNEYNFSAPADKKFHETRFIRGVLIYFPITSTDYYRDELKWLYRSWIHMIKFEPPKWRTDLIVFVEHDKTRFNGSGSFFMEQMNCTFENKRKSAEDKPMCTLINYVALKKRTFDTPSHGFANDDEKYQYLLKDVDIFKTDNPNEFDTFYKLLKASLSNYGYLDSILMAFEGYS